MKRRILFALITATLLGSGLLRGQAEEEPVYTLDECIVTALNQNPLVLSSLQQYQASIARVSQANAFEQPSIDWDSDLQPSFLNFKKSGEHYIGLSQSFQFPGKRILRGKIASKESQELLAEIDLLKLDITFQVKQAFFGLLLAQERLKYAQQNLGLAQDFLQKAELKFDAGDVAKVEVLRARVEAARAANHVRVAKNDVKLAKATLNFLLARKKYEPITIQGDLKKPPMKLELDLLRERALSFRPEMRRVNFSLERERLRKKQATMSYLPDFTLGVNRHHIDGEGSFWDVTLSFPIPLFFWQPKKGQIAEAEANIRSLQREAEHIINSISLEVEEAYMNAVTADNQIQLFEEDILNQAEEVYNMFLFSYQEGEIGSIELIDARRTLIEARQAYADALFNYGAALATLERSIGQTLEGE
ncbi:MAG: TolC family protein [Candidatus Aminicenantes bacterium]|nr:TolC family protein [Candidatus Aminicenantes bacterium]